MSIRTAKMKKAAEIEINKQEGQLQMERQRREGKERIRGSGGRVKETEVQEDGKGKERAVVDTYDTIEEEDVIPHPDDKPRSYIEVNPEAIQRGDKIGEGSFGVVYCGTCQVVENGSVKVAIKMAREQFPSKQMLRRFKKEVVLYVCAWVGVFGGGCCWMVMHGDAQ